MKDRASYGASIQRLWRDNHLFAVLVELTYKCNLDCAFCFNDLSLRGKLMTKRDYFAFFDDLAAMGVMHVTLSGGEPLSHPDFFAIGARARELGFVVRVKTNGHALRAETARRLRDEVDPFVVEVSLHGATAATHDRQTRVPGSFERLLVNLRSAIDCGLRIKLNSTLTVWNEHEAEGMMDLADDLRVVLQIDPEVTPRDDGDRAPLALTASRAGLHAMFRAQEKRAQAKRAIAPTESRAPAPVSAPKMTEKHCGAGSSSMALDPYGNVYPCVQWRRIVGNVHERSIRDLWTTSDALANVRAQTVAAGRMVEREGASGALLAFCPGAAEAATGDATRLYPSAQRRRDVALDVADKLHLPLVQ